MTQVPPEDDGAPQPDLMPPWVPIVIGVVLVTIAGLAVFTGMRYRDQTLVQMVKPRATQPRLDRAGPSAEPEAGGSLVSAGVPQANQAVTGAARAEVTGGGAAGIHAVVRMWARRGMQIQSTPDDALVYVNNVPVGTAKQFDSENEIYDFAEPGSYTVRLEAPGYNDRVYIVTADDKATTDVARIEARLAPAPAPARR